MEKGVKLKLIQVESGRTWTYVTSRDFSKHGWIVFSYQFARVYSNNGEIPSHPCPEIFNITLPIECINQHLSTLKPHFVDESFTSRQQSSKASDARGTESIATTLDHVARHLHGDTTGSRNPIAILDVTHSTSDILFRCEGAFASTVKAQFELLFTAANLSYKSADDTIESKLGFALPSGNSGCDILLSVPAKLFFDAEYSNILGFTNKLISTIAFGLVASSSVIGDSMSFQE